ncbi:sensor histidine kinase, partial [Phytoactinopolyspora endophytica]|uniref:sensor histidine kinase n=1 Tax=Phytoactinopolyspora endophytica TaxID=1642495 RepID=UPI0013ED3EFC
MADEREVSGNGVAGGPAALSRFKPRFWWPWLGALALFAMSLQSVDEVLDVSGVLIPVVAAAAALPFGLIASQPLLGWALSAGGALLVSRTLAVTDGDPWPWPAVHGLVLLALLFAVGFIPPARLRRGYQIAIMPTTWLATGTLFAVSVPDDIRAGWTVGPILLGMAGLIAHLAGMAPRRTAPAEPAVPLAALPATLLAAFREAFIDWGPSPMTGRPVAERWLSRYSWSGRFRDAVPWILAVGVFWIEVGSIHETLVVHDVALPFLSALIALPVGLARRYPLIGWRLITLTAVVVAVIGTPSEDGADPGTWPVPMQWVWLILMFLVTVRHGRWVAIWVWAATIAVLSAGTGDEAGTTAITMLVAASALALIGDLLRTRRMAGQEVERQTELSDLEKARRTVLEERARIARDLHDVVAHHMSMVVVQAETAPYRLPDVSDAAAGEFASISASARQALTEIRSMLGVLRSDGQDVLTTPQPGLDQLEELVAGARRSGVPVSWHTSGTPPEVSTAAGLSVYRILQESLANAARHAPGASVTVDVGYTPETVELRIVNTAPAEKVAPTGAGHGLIGMRERAAVVGGSLETGPRPDGGYEVRAVIPLDAATIGSADMED